MISERIRERSQLKFPLELKNVCHYFSNSIWAYLLPTPMKGFVLKSRIYLLGINESRGEFTKTNIFVKPCFQCICVSPKRIFSRNHDISVFIGSPTRIFNKVFSLFCCSPKLIHFGEQFVLVNSPLFEDTEKASIRHQ